MEKIVSFINQSTNEVSIKEIKRSLSLDYISNNDMRKELQNLCDKGFIFYNEENDTYCSLGKNIKLWKFYVLLEGIGILLTSLIEKLI